MASLEGKVTICETIVSYDFGDKLLCAIALSTFPYSGPFHGVFQALPRNDRMAVYGDSVASSYLCRRWVDTDLQKGEWDTIRQAVLGNRNLAAIGFAHELRPCVMLNPGTTTLSAKTMATTVEAILGAVFIDGGDAALAQVMGTLGLTHTLLEVETSTPPAGS